MSPSISGEISEVNRCALYPIVMEALGGNRAAETGWCVTVNRHWISVANHNVQSLSQGWKLHITGTVRDGTAILDKVLPLLARDLVAFKTVTSIQQLLHLNQGKYGSTQVGKFITVYPTSADHAVRLAVELDRCTQQFQGTPRVPSDRRLRKGSLIHYRYGCFTNCYMQTTLGEIVPAIQKPDGSLVPDVRKTSYTSYTWVTDPFVAAGISSSEPATLMVGTRYLVVEVKDRSIRNTIFTAIDTSTGEPCILKQAHHSEGLYSSSNPEVRLRHEAGILRFLSKELPIPSVRDVILDNGDPVMVIDYCDGVSLEEHIATLAAQGRFLQQKELVSLGLQIINLLGEIHERGLAYGDLKPPNIIVNPENQTVHLVDFEAACWFDTNIGPEIIGTPGFASPNRLSGGRSCIADDIYAFGAVLYFMATGADPSHAPNPRCLLERPPQLINPQLSLAIARVIEACLEPETTHRPPNALAVSEVLRCASMSTSGT